MLLAQQIKFPFFYLLTQYKKQNTQYRKYQSQHQIIYPHPRMQSPQQQALQLQQKLKSINSVQVQSFIQQFHNSTTTLKTFSFIEDNFIKKHRFKNSLNQNTSNPNNSIQEFINGFKETISYYHAYHEYVESTLDKFLFTKDLKRFLVQLQRSESRVVNFLLTELELHRGFVEENEKKYHKKIEGLNNVCSSCKENIVMKELQSIKQNARCNFSDPFKLYEQRKFTPVSTLPHFSTNYEPTYPMQRLQELQSNQQKMKRLIRESKQINFSKLDDIYDHFDTKQQLQVYALNKVKVNDMFYDLQTQLQNQTNNLEQYVEDLVGFNDKLVNYNPNVGTKINEQHGSEQTEPKEVELQLKYNFGKIIRKIYNKLLQIIKKRKQDSISVQTQANITQQSAIRELQKHNKRLQLQLRQSQQEKKFLITALKEQNETLKDELKRLNEQNSRIDVARQEALLERNAHQRKEDKMMKVINQLKKEVERLSNGGERRDGFSKKDVSEGRVKSRFNLDHQNQNQRQQVIQQDEQQSPHNGKPANKRIIDLSKVHFQSANTLSHAIQTGKSPQQLLLQQFQEHERQLMKSLTSKKLKHKKKYMQPRRSKLLETITLEDSGLKKEMSKFSMRNIESGDNEEGQDNDYGNSISASEILEADNNYDDFEGQQQGDEGTIRQPTIMEVIERNQQTDSQDNDNQTQLQLPKNHKSKTFTKTNPNDQIQSINQRGHTSHQISQTDQDVHKRLEDLQKLKEIKQLQMKLNLMAKKCGENLTIKNNPDKRSTIGFHIEKQVQETINLPKRNKSVDKTKSLTKKSIPQSGVHHQSLYKDDLLKRFGKSSQNLKSSLIESKQSLTQLKQFSSQSQTNSDKKPCNSSVSITSKNFLSYCEQICREIEENKCHVGTQTLWSQEEMLRMLYELELQQREWNEVILTFESFKFGYGELLNQLSQLILREEKNPIRKLNGFRGSSQMLKKTQNYRFNKQNLLYSNQKTENNQTDMNGSNEDQRKAKKVFFKTMGEKSYFIPKISDSFNNDTSKMNNKTMNGFHTYNKLADKKQIPSQKQLNNCVTLADFNNTHKQFKTLQPLSVDSLANINEAFKKKSYYTQYKVKTEHNVREDSSQGNSYFYKDQTESKLPIIKESMQINTIRMPSFEKEDAENLFFTIESAKLIEQNLRNIQSTQTFFTLQQQEIRFTTQILAILAHVHLLEPKSYEQIKNLLLYPARLLANKRKQIIIGQEQNNHLHQMEENQAQLSLKKGLGYILQLHRKCLNKTAQDGKLRSRTKDNLRLVQNVSKKNTCMCQHLKDFRTKIRDVIKTHEALKIQEQSRIQ